MYVTHVTLHLYWEENNMLILIGVMLLGKIHKKHKDQIDSIKMDKKLKETRLAKQCWLKNYKTSVTGIVKFLTIS